MYWDCFWFSQARRNCEIFATAFQKHLETPSTIQHCKCIWSTQRFLGWDISADYLPEKAMKTVKIKKVMKVPKVKSMPKFTTKTDAETTDSTKNKAPTKTFKTSERNRVYTKGYCRKLAELKKQGLMEGGKDYLEPFKKLARDAGKALLTQSGFSICKGDIQSVI